MRKIERIRPYPPEFVGLETLAYLMDCATSTIEKYVADGVLPAATCIGNLARWHWPAIREMISNDKGVDDEEPKVVGPDPAADRAKLYKQRVAEKNAG